MRCPYCGYKIDNEYFEFESLDIWWCKNCGSIAEGHNGLKPEKTEWSHPLNIDMK